ncbi:MAG: DUF4810 domain-containing protein [Pseudoxanthomonas sp.]
MKMISAGASRWLALCALLSLTACAHRPQSIYQWGSYQDQVYRHFKGEGPEGQIQALEKDIQVTRASNRQIPPGLHAHLGMLYAEIGNDGKARESLLAEKTIYPESTAYMDLLLKKYEQ